MLFFFAFVSGIITLFFLPSFCIELKKWNCSQGNCREVRSDAITIFIAICVCFISCFGLVKIDKKSYQETEETKRYELISIQDGSQISGHANGNLFYVHASIDMNDVYTFYYKFKNGYKKGKIKSKNVIIYEQDNCNPLIIKYTTYTKSKMNNVLTAILSFNAFKELPEVSYKIYVPKGTILQTFKLDAQ